jgi:hypothetical protein
MVDSFFLRVEERIAVLRRMHKTPLLVRGCAVSRNWGPCLLGMCWNGTKQEVVITSEKLAWTVDN